MALDFLEDVSLADVARNVHMLVFEALVGANDVLLGVHDLDVPTIVEWPLVKGHLSRPLLLAALTEVVQACMDDRYAAIVQSCRKIKTQSVIAR